MEKNGQLVNDLIKSLMIHSYLNELMIKDLLQRSNLKPPSIDEQNEMARIAKLNVKNTLASFEF